MKRYGKSINGSGALSKGKKKLLQKEDNTANESIKVTRWHFMQYEVSLKSSFTEMYLLDNQLHEIYLN
ncbi:hypothetical protein FEM33_20815 [Dyadobacter flavalbus]|uniref:Uncharacterized protein n=1 Tax=Dyadobacter flavalbus TaxID=2579942 RepID=A0A5M8QNJ1_9BACT|nr:hypothetical protein [Dyadobacter flavalbus]KAA6436590.1 hypothetical protein FEM33_20815 [Dyadobacter flavalbus]